MMGFLQEPIFTAFVALILSFVVAKIVSFAVSSPSNGGSVVSSVNEGSVGEGVGLSRGLRVGRAKGEKRVKFVDDVEIRRIDRYEESENLEFSDEKFDEGVDQLDEDSRVENEKIDGEGSEKGEMVIEKEGGRVDREEGKSVIVEVGFDDEKEVTKRGKSVIVEEEKIEVGFDEKEVKGLGENEGIVEEDDDWEGIERSELEKVFAEAVNYVEYGGRKEREDDHLENLSSDVQMELYGLHKVAVEGPCLGPQPMALKLSARAKWNAWQRLGSMSRETAMEQYIRVLSDNIPAWMHHFSADDNIERKLETLGKISDTQTLGKISDTQHERKSVGDTGTGQTSVEKDDDV